MSFSLILDYSNSRNCMNLNCVNEGVLVTAILGDGSVLPLQYFVHGNTICDTVHHINIMLINATYYNLTTLENVSYVVPFNSTTAKGPVKYTITLSDYRVLTQNVSFSWTQYHYEPNGEDCDVWSLDNVTLSVNINGTNDIVYSEDFNDENLCSSSWNCTLAEWRDSDWLCGGNNNSCLYFTGEKIKDCIAVSPVINKHLLACHNELPEVALHTSETNFVVPCDRGNL